MKKIIFVVAALLVVLLAGQAFGDKLILKNGTVIDGKVTKEGDVYVVKTSTSTRTYPARLVARVEYGETNEEIFEDKLADLGGFESEDATALYELALWAKERRLSKQYKSLLERVAELDPSHDEAQAALGKVKYMGVWMPEEEMFVRTGKDLYNGEWLDIELVARKRARAKALPHFQRTAAMANEYLRYLKQGIVGEGKREVFNSLCELENMFPGIRTYSQHAMAEGQSRSTYAGRRVTVEIRAADGTLRAVRQIVVQLAAGVSVVIECPELQLTSIKTTVICPTN